MVFLVGGCCRHCDVLQALRVSERKCMGHRTAPVRSCGIVCVCCGRRSSMRQQHTADSDAAMPPAIPLLQVITYEKSLRTAEYAFEFAYLNNRRRVTAVHKANIMKKGDGMFLKVGGGRAVDVAA